MGSYERIHLANSTDALELLAARNCPNMKNFKFRQVCNALEKLYKESQKNVLDQEMTYILLCRYITIYKTLEENLPDKKFIEIRFGSEYKKVLAQHKQTQQSLQLMYDLMKRTEETPPQDDDMIVDDTPHRIFNDEFINCQELFSALGAKYNILLVDARPDKDFLQSRIDNPNCINVPDQCITSGLSANTLGKKLPLETQKVWERRDTFDVIVLFDWSSTVDTFRQTKLDKLRSALVDWDLNKNYSEKPVILNGGYLELLHTYPTLCTNPHVYLYQKNKDLDELLELDNIEYPTESDNKSQVMGPLEDSSVSNGLGRGDKDESVTKESLIRENKEIIINRQGIIEQLMREENEWKKINDMCNKETNNVNLATLRQKESRIRTEISLLEETLDDLNARKADVMNKFDSSFQYDLEEEMKKEELKEITQIEADDLEKLKILDVVADQRCKALEKARASKPKKEKNNKGTNNNIHQFETDRPVINRATKPVTRSQTARLRNENLNNMTSGLVGLRNIRNTCYMNTVIQCLRNIPDIVRLFCRGMYTSYNIRHPSAIIQETAHLIRQLWSVTYPVYDPQEFYNKVCAIEATYKLGNHEDCMEFFLFLLNHLSEDCSYEIPVPNIMTPKQKAWFNQFEGKNSVLIDLFYHQIRIRQNCPKCDQKTYKFEIESTFMLSVPEFEDDFHVNDLMRDYMADYTITDFCCSKCKIAVKNRKEICYEPKIMVMVLKRYRQEVQNGVLTLRKIQSRAHFDTSGVKLGKCFYKLSAIAMHSGDMNYGHYTAAALTPDGWYEFNDEIVRQISINDESIKTKACAFFYSMCDDY